VLLSLGIVLPGSVLVALRLPARSHGPTPGYVEAPALIRVRHEGNELYQSGENDAALRVYATGVAAARQAGDSRSAVRFLNNIGGVNYRLLRYRDAVKAYLEARALAAGQGQADSIAAISVNLSSLYIQMGELEAANEAAAQGLAIPSTANRKVRPQLLIQWSILQLRQKNCAPAAQGFRQAIDAARDQLDVATEAQAWNELGNAFIECGQVSAAEQPLLESYRLRKLTHDERIQFSYESLAELRLAEKNPDAARILLDRAIESAASLGPAALWRPLHARGRANLAEGHTEAAYHDLLACLRNLKKWRTETLPADTFRLNTEVELHRVYASFIEVAASLYRKTGEQRYAEASFEAAESERAVSLRMLWRSSDAPRHLPDEYWRTVGELHRAESEQFQHSSDAGTARRLRLKLAEMETAAGLERATGPEDDGSPGKLLQAARHALGNDESFLGFYTGDSEGWLWVLTQKHLDLISLPSESVLTRQVSGFADAIQQGSPTARELGRQLYRDLFGRLSSEAQGSTTWILAADGPLFELPFAALVEDSPRPGPPKYLIEARTIRMTTGISALLRPVSRVWNDLYVGVADPIYNRADPRLASVKRSTATSMLKGFGSRSTPSILELPRLPGSAREIEACADVWRSNGEQTALLTGAAASTQNLTAALQRRPSVLHFAGHMLFPPGDRNRGFLALALQPGSGIDFLSDTETAGMSSSSGLVVLSGCSSGRGAVLPGAGLMGMTRAWLAAGSRAVIATRWPASDQDGKSLFSSFYRLYFERRAKEPFSFGALLRESQLAELRAGGSRADPARWASYFCVERN
jgi:CHAT domain-containing protein